MVGFSSFATSRQGPTLESCFTIKFVFLNLLFTHFIMHYLVCSYGRFFVYSLGHSLVQIFHLELQVQKSVRCYPIIIIITPTPA